MRKQPWLIMIAAGMLIVVAAIIVSCYPPTEDQVRFQLTGDVFPMDMEAVRGIFPTGTPSPAGWRPGLIYWYQGETPSVVTNGQVGARISIYWDNVQVSPSQTPNWNNVASTIDQFTGLGLNPWIELVGFTVNDATDGAYDSVSFPGVPTVTYLKRACNANDIAPDYSSQEIRDVFDTTIQSMVTRFDDDVAGYILGIGADGEGLNVKNSTTCWDTQASFEEHITCDQFVEWVKFAMRTIRKYTTKPVYLPTGIGACAGQPANNGYNANREFMEYSVPSTPTGVPPPGGWDIELTPGPYYIGWGNLGQYPNGSEDWCYGDNDGYCNMQMAQRMSELGGALFHQDVSPTRIVPAIPTAEMVAWTRYTTLKAIANGAQNIEWSIHGSPSWGDLINADPWQVEVITQTMGTTATNSPAIWLAFTGPTIPRYFYSAPNRSWGDYPYTFSHLSALRATATPTIVCMPGPLAAGGAPTGSTIYTGSPYCQTQMTATPNAAAYVSLQYSALSVIGIDVDDAWQYASPQVVTGTYTAKLIALDTTNTITVTWKVGNTNTTEVLTFSNTRAFVTKSWTMTGAELRNPYGSALGDWDIQVNIGANAATLHMFWLEWVAGSAAQTPTPTSTATTQSTSTPTPTKTLTPTRTLTPTSSSTPTSTPTSTATSTYTPSPTPTGVFITPTPTATSTVSSTPTATRTATRTLTPTVTRTPTGTRTSTSTPTSTSTATSTSTSSPTAAVTVISPTCSDGDNAPVGCPRSVAIYADFPNNNYYSEGITVDQLGYDVNHTPYANMLLRWPALSLPSGAYVLNATLTLKAIDANVLNTYSATLYRVVRTWVETGATWRYTNIAQSNLWTVGGARGSGDRRTTGIALSLPMTTAGTKTITIDVTDDVRAWLDLGTADYGWVMEMTDPCADPGAWSGCTSSPPPFWIVSIAGSNHQNLSLRPSLSVTFGYSLTPTPTLTKTPTSTPVPTYTSTPTATSLATSTPTKTPICVTVVAPMQGTPPETFNQYQQSGGVAITPQATYWAYNSSGTLGYARNRLYIAVPQQTPYVPINANPDKSIHIKLDYQLVATPSASTPIAPGLDKLEIVSGYYPGLFNDYYAWVPPALYLEQDGGDPTLYALELGRPYGALYQLTLSEGAWHTIEIYADQQPSAPYGTYTPMPNETPAYVIVDGTPQATVTPVTGGRWNAFTGLTTISGLTEIWLPGFSDGGYAPEWYMKNVEIAVCQCEGGSCGDYQPEATYTPTATSTATSTSTSTSTSTPTSTSTSTSTATPTPTGAWSSPTPTATATKTPTATSTTSFTATPTSTATPTPVAGLKINEICPLPNTDLNLDGAINKRDRAIELFVPSSAADLEGYRLEWDSSLATTYIFPRFSRIFTGGYKVVWGDELETVARIPFDFPTSGIVRLYSQYGDVLDVITYSAVSAGSCYRRYPNGSPLWSWSTTPTLGRIN